MKDLKIIAYIGIWTLLKMANFGAEEVVNVVTFMFTVGCKMGLAFDVV